MIDGCLAWQRGGLVRPKVVVDATAEYFCRPSPNARQRACHGSRNAYGSTTIAPATQSMIAATQTAINTIAQAQKNNQKTEQP
jgi:hypothetical protein